MIVFSDIIKILFESWNSLLSVTSWGALIGLLTLAYKLGVRNTKAHETLEKAKMIECHTKEIMELLKKYDQEIFNLRKELFELYSEKQIHGKENGGTTITNNSS